MSDISQAELFRKTVEHIGEYLEEDVSHLTPSSRLDTAVSGLDSLKLFEMTLYLEDCFEIDLDETQFEKIRTVQDLIDQIKSQLEIRSGTSSAERRELPV